MVGLDKASMQLTSEHITLLYFAKKHTNKQNPQTNNKKKTQQQKELVLVEQSISTADSIILTLNQCSA